MGKAERCGNRVRDAGKVAVGRVEFAVERGGTPGLLRGDRLDAGGAFGLSLQPRLQLCNVALRR